MDDVLCVGAVDNILLSSPIGRNKNLIPGEMLGALVNGTEEVLQVRIVVHCFTVSVIPFMLGWRIPKDRVCERRREHANYR